MSFDVDTRSFQLVKAEQGVSVVYVNWQRDQLSAALMQLPQLESATDPITS